MRGPALRRDHVIAASLAGAVVIVVGYASGIGLRPGGTAAASAPSVVDGGHQNAPATSGEQPLPPSLPTSGVPVSPLPALPAGDQQVPAVPPMPSLPGGVDVEPTPTAPEPTSTPPATTPPPPPPGTGLPACQAGAAQQVLDTVGGLPVLGAVTTGLGVTGPDGLGATILGYCRKPDGGVELAMVPATAVPSVPSGR